MRYYLVSWCREGIECLQDITEFQDWKTTNAFAVLTGEAVKSCPLNSRVAAMRRQARFNAQLNYEIYVFTSTSDVNMHDIISWAKSSPKSFADWVKKNHTVCLFKNCDSTRSVIE
jgi:hypothetical protein